MFIKKIKKSKDQTYYYLTESYRDKGKVKHRTLLYLGKDGEDRIDELTAAIAKHREIYNIIELAKNISVENTYILGPLLVLERIFKKYGVDSVLEIVANAHPAIGFNLRNLIFTMASMRFVEPGSKLKIYEHWQKKLYPEMIEKNIGLHQLYRALDILALHKEEIEKDLYWHDRDLFSSVIDVILYDLTTLRFESTRTDLGKLRQFGYSKERRSDCTQVVLGLLVTPDGVPVGFEVYPGNTFEGKTISDIANKLRNKYNIRRFIFVGDRGLFSKKNLDELRSKDGESEFIVGMKLGVFKERHNEFYDINKYNFINENLACYETTHNGDRCIITWSKSRAERDRKAREEILEKIRKKISKKKITTKEFVTNKTYQRYVIGLEDKKNFIINEKAIEEDAMKDGYFGVVTNVAEMKAQEIIENYKTLWIIEDAFGEIKGNLKARPIFHWTDQRILGHLTLCFIAYYCEAIMTKALREKNLILESPAIDNKIIKPRPLTVVEAMKELQEVRAIPVNVRSSTIWVRTDISGNAYKLFSAIGLKIPPKLLQLKKNEKCSATN